ncbi:phylloplanin-like [Cucurbita maxima]|uniref:Phylloplanin-like n=1 Tax=Cucurbita maxima TaxID=3661 RepID=A0A6J1IE70_CUCMA|nr:phylloplanin-like [Cucurbita maxima]
MGLKSVLFVLVMAAAMGAPLMVAEAQLGSIGSLLSLTRIQGTVFCTADGNIGANGTATPIFPNAAVQLQCGNGNVVSTATTNSAGMFLILLNPLQFLLSSLTSNCSVLVNTPLSSCNATLPSVGNLVSGLNFAGTILQGLLSITNIIPRGFTFQPST